MPRGANPPTLAGTPGPDPFWSRPDRPIGASAVPGGNMTWRADWESRAGAAPVTVTVSARLATAIVKSCSARATCADDTSTEAAWNPDSVAVTRYDCAASRPSKVYRPLASV